MPFIDSLIFSEEKEKKEIVRRSKRWLFILLKKEGTRERERKREKGRERKRERHAFACDNVTL